eukprot:594777-Pyramimonas_sp.AAC.1
MAGRAPAPLWAVTRGRGRVMQGGGAISNCRADWIDEQSSTRDKHRPGGASSRVTRMTNAA